MNLPDDYPVGTTARNQRLDYLGKKPCTEYEPGELDRGIKRVVRRLQAEGIATYESCEGGEGHTYPRPAVRFHGEFAEGFRALAVAITYGFQFIASTACGVCWTVNRKVQCGSLSYIILYWINIFRP